MIHQITISIELFCLAERNGSINKILFFFFLTTEVKTHCAFNQDFQSYEGHHSIRGGVWGGSGGSGMPGERTLIHVTEGMGHIDLSGG